MKTVNFTNKSFMSWLAMAMLCMFAVGANAQVCSTGSSTVLDPETCEAVLGTTDLVSGGTGVLKVKLLEASEHYKQSIPADDAIVGNETASVTVSIPGTYKYQHIVDGIEGCWGTFIVEDKSGPFCANVPVNEGDSDESDNPDDRLQRQILQVSCTNTNPLAGLKELEANDFEDCTGIKEVWSVDSKISECDLADMTVGAIADELNVPNRNVRLLLDKEAPAEGFELCEIYARSWYASDWDGNVSEQDRRCVQLVGVYRPTIIKMDMSVKAECGESPATGAPYMLDIDGMTKIELTAGEHICKYAASYHADPIIYTCQDKDGCEGNERNYKQAKHWTVFDWCTGQKAFGFVTMPNGEEVRMQLDEVTVVTAVSDETAPVLRAIPEPTYWGNPYDCTFELKFEKIFADDACQGIIEADFSVEIATTDAHGNSYGGSFENYTKAEALAGIDGIPAGAEVTIKASAWDCCGNYSDEESTFTVGGVDTYAPICVANDELEVSLIKTDAHDNTDPAGHMVGTRVYPEDVDENSSDNCGIAYMKIRKAKKHVPGENTSLKDDEGWANFVEYEYSQEEFAKIAGEKCEVEMWVDLLVVDNTEADNLIGANYSICSARLILRDNTPASISKIGMHQSYSCLDHDVPTPGGIEVWGNCFDTDSANDGFEFHCPVDVQTARAKVIDLTQELIEALSGKKLTDEQVVDLLGKNMGGIPNLGNLWITSVDVTAYDVVKKTEHGASHDFAAIAIFEYSEEDETFVFPQDYKVECSSEGIPAPATLEEILDNRGCSEWVMNVTEKTFLGAEDACYKIIRNYEFINWCRWDENLTNDNAQIDKTCADIDGDGKILGKERVAITYRGVHGQSSYDQLSYISISNGNSSYGCGDDESKKGRRYSSDLELLEDGYFNYTQVIKVTDSVDPTGDIEAKVSCDASIDDCHQGVVVFEVSGADACSDATFSDYDVVAETTYGDDVAKKFKRDGNTVYAKGLPVGKYTLKALIEDSCGNSIWVTETAVVEVADCKKPTPIAYATFTAVMDDADCTAEVWLSDLVSSVTDNCEKYGDVETAIELVSDANNDGIINALDLVDSPLAEEDADYAKYDVVTVTQVGVNTVALWARDAAGNTQFALAPITAIDNGGNCGGGDAADIAGKITNENDEMIDQVIVTAKGSGMVDFKSIFDGTFNVTAVPMNSDVTISAEKNVGHLNGVSTADLVLLQRHVLGITPLTSAYKVIAADANNDTKIDTRDMLHISRLILGIYTELPNNNSWRFVAKDHVFANPTSPWGFVEAINFSELSADAQADFIGIKIGDLSGNALASNLLGSDDTKVGKMNIAIEDATIAAGETQTIEFTAADFNNFAGYQFSIALDSRVEFAGIEAGELAGVSDANFGLSALENGIITTNWANAAGVTVDNGTVLFSLNVTANETVNVSDILTVNSAVTPAEAYNSDLDVFEVGVQFSRTDASFALFQNTPNPVSGETLIGFNLPTASTATLTVMDVAGRTILTRGGDFAKGYNTIALDKSDLNATGVLYYQLETENNSATMKMVILD